MNISTLVILTTLTSIIFVILLFFPTLLTGSKTIKKNGVTKYRSHFCT